MTSKFDAFFNDAEEETINSIKDIMTAAYNQGVSDSQDALLSINQNCVATELFVSDAENAIVDLFVDPQN